MFLVGGPIACADVPELCERVRACLERCDGCDVVCDVGALAGTDAATVEALARLQLTAQRLGRRLHLRRASAELRELVELVGLRETLPCEDALAVEPGREPEEREERLGIEEGVEADDPTA